MFPSDRLPVPSVSPIRRHSRILFALAILVLWLSTAFSLTHAQDTTDAPTAQPSATPIPKPLPAQVLTSEDGFTVELFFDSIAQGNVGLIHVSGAGISEARARFLNKLIDLFPSPNDGFYGLLSANMEQNPRSYELSVFVSQEDGGRGSLTTQVNVVQGQFIRQDINIRADLAYLIDPELEREEIARLESITSQVTLQHLWDSYGFTLPVNSELTSPFGAFRLLNETVQSRHTGWDQRAVLGTPVMTIASGTVVFAGPLDIRGNYVMIDHGYGIFTGYAHLSQIHVTRGQSIASGQIIGVSGDTGRGNGPHLHWEVAVNGLWVDGVDFLKTWLPPME